MAGKKWTRKDPMIMTPPPSPLNTNTCLNSASPLATPSPPPPQTIFSAQSYLHYQGQKFNTHFDTNCYILIIHKMDLHNILHDWVVPSTDTSTDTDAITLVLSSLPPTLTIFISSDTTQRMTMINYNPEIVLTDFGTCSSQHKHTSYLLNFSPPTQ